MPSWNRFKKDLISSKLNLSSFFAGIELISKDKSILSINEIVLPSLTSPFIRLIDVTKLKVSGFSVPIFLTIWETVRQFHSNGTLSLYS